MHRLGMQMRHAPTAGSHDSVKLCPQEELVLPAGEMDSRREAAAKIAKNRAALVSIVLHGSGQINPSGVLHVPSSAYGAHVQDVDGKATTSCEVAVSAVVENALQRLCVYLLTGDSGSSPEDKEEIAIQVVTLAFLRNLASSPRDMTAGAASEFRLACDAVISKAYVFPN